MSNMFENYRCAQWFNACNDFWNLLKKNIQIIPSIKNHFDEAKHTIKEANKAFSEAYLKQKDTQHQQNTEDIKIAEQTNLTEKQIELLRTVYGLDTSKITQNQGFGLVTLLNRNVWKNLINSVNFQTLDVLSAESILARKQAQEIRQTNRQDQKYLQELKEKTKEEATDQIKEITKNEIQRLENIMSWSISFGSDREIKDQLIQSVNISLSQKTDDKLKFILYSNVSITSYFFEIGRLIQIIVDEYIWTKDSSGLIKNLGKVCELQCENKGISFCYVK